MFGGAESFRAPLAQEVTEAGFGVLLGTTARAPEREVRVVQNQGSPVDVGIERCGDIKDSIFAYRLLDSIFGEKVQTLFTLDDLIPADLSNSALIATPVQ